MENDGFEVKRRKLLPWLPIGLLILFLVCLTVLIRGCINRPTTDAQVLVETHPAPAAISIPGLQFLPQVYAQVTETPIPSKPGCDDLPDRIKSHPENPPLTEGSLWQVICHRKSAFPDGNTAVLFSDMDGIVLIIGHCEEPDDEIPPKGTDYKVVGGLLEPDNADQQTFRAWQYYYTPGK